MHHRREKRRIPRYQHGLAASRTLAAKLIDAGCVSVNGKIVYKASQ
ncbi:MAG: S4 domain-containing protein, partial [Neisseria elongata]